MKKSAEESSPETDSQKAAEAVTGEKTLVSAEDAKVQETPKKAEPESEVPEKSDKKEEKTEDKAEESDITNGEEK